MFRIKLANDLNERFPTDFVKNTRRC